MASATSDAKVILTRSEDWQKWYWQLQASVNSEIWPYINPEGEERALLALPRRPEFRDFSQQAQTYADLSSANKKNYDQTRRVYDKDMRYYSRQQDLLQAARVHITSTVSQAKQSSLDPSLSVREWLVKLKKDTEPAKGYMLLQTKKRYDTTFKDFKPRKLHQWLDEWENTMVECIKYDLPEMKNGHWLRHLTEYIRPVSDALYVQLLTDADDDAKSDPAEFRSVARKLREILPARVDRRITRGGAFPAGFGPTEQSDDSSNATNTKEAEKAKPQGRKRAGTRSQESNASKKVTPECIACGMRGHSLPECWCIFEELRPEGAKSPAYRVRKAKKALEKNEDLRKQVEALRAKEGQAASRKN
jgi:hypothetical protein